MAQFPTSIPTPTVSNTSDTLAHAGHTALHNNLSAEVTAIATKVGSGSSLPAANTVLHGNGSGSTWDSVNVSSDVTGILPTSHGGTGTTNTVGTGSVVFSNNPTLVTPSFNNGGVWNGGPTINQPTITDFSNAGHDHSSAVEGGTLATSILHNPFKFSVTANSQTISSGITTKITWDTILFDTSGNFDNGNDRFTTPLAGFYQFNVNAQMYAIGATAILELYVNGALTRTLVRTGNNNAGTCAGSAMLELSLNDYVEVFVFQNQGFNGTLDGAYFDGFLVSTS